MGNGESEGSQRVRVAQELKDLWDKRDLTGFLSRFQGHGQVIIESGLRREFPRLSEEDWEELFDQALEVMVGRFMEGIVIESPFNYCWGLVRKLAINLVQQREEWGPGGEDPFLVLEQLSATPQGESGGAEPGVEVSCVDPAWAEAVAYEMVEEAEPAPEWVQPVVEEAIRRLAPGQRAVISYLASRSWDEGYPDAHTAAASLGISPANYRNTKSQAFKRLRQLLPVVVIELGIELPPRVEQSLFQEQGKEDD